MIPELFRYITIVLDIKRFEADMEHPEWQTVSDRNRTLPKTSALAVHPASLSAQSWS
jgi:hypothetical protein